MGKEGSVLTTEETRKRRRGATEASNPQDAQPVLELEAIREIVAQAIRAALDPIIDSLAVLETETRKTRVALDHFGPQLGLGKDEAGEEEWLAEQREDFEQESQATDMVREMFSHLHPRGRSGRTSFRAGLPVAEPGMIEILPRCQEEEK